MSDKEKNNFNKVQINYIRRKGTDRWGKEISTTEVMFNVRENDPEEAVRLYRELKEAYYGKPKSAESEAESEEQ